MPTSPSLTFLRTATITLATAIAVGGVLVIAGDDDTPDARERKTSPAWPGDGSSLSVVSSAPGTTSSAPTSTTAPPTTTTTPPPRQDTPAPAPATEQPAPPTGQQPPPESDPGPPVPGEPCDTPGEYGYTADGEPVLCIAAPGTTQPRWHLGPE